MECSFKISHYDEYVNQFKKMSLKYNKVITRKELLKYNLPSQRWFVKNFPYYSINTWSEFIMYCGFFTPNCTKEFAIKLIKQRVKSMNRPLQYKDVISKNCSIQDVPISTIIKFWGSLNKMKYDLGLEIVQEDMVCKHLDKEGFDKECKLLFEYIEENNLHHITRKIINSYKLISNYECLEKACKNYYNMSLKEYFNYCGYSIGKCGSGCSYIYPDGEKTQSIYEQIFTNLLRKEGLIYNKDYFRSVRYSEFVPEYNQLMNCDYKIIWGNRIIYIEIAGILEAYKSYYYQNKPITSSKSKEQYRKKLQEKETMFINNHLDYYILFPCDLSDDIVHKILDGIDKYNIESFIKNNIDWQKINLEEGIKYNGLIKWGRNTIVYAS